MKGVEYVVEDAPETPVQVLLREVVGMRDPGDHELLTGHWLSPFPCTSRSIEDGYKRVKLANQRERSRSLDRWLFRAKLLWR